MAGKEFECVNCHKKYNSYKKESKFCSIECRKDYYKRIEYHCDYCGKTMYIEKRRYNDYINGKKKGIYCSHKCASDSNIKDKIKRICEYCSNEFYVDESMKSTKFCSRECYNKSIANNSIKRIVICPKCGKSFSTYHKNQKFCSKKCSSENSQKRVRLTCDTCGKEFTRIISSALSAESHYCSKECSQHRLWSKSETEILKTYYYLVPMDDLLEMLNHKFTKEQIISKVNNMKFTKSRLWNDNEVALLKEYYPISSYEELNNMFPNRTLISIIGKARTLGLIRKSTLEKYYTEEDNEYIKQNFLKKSIDEIANHLNRTPSGIINHARILGLRNPKTRKSDGYYDLNNYIRARLDTWKNNYKKKVNYTCELSGAKNNLVVHHIKGYNLILDEAFLLCNIEQKDDFNDYTMDELHQLFDAFFYLQEEEKLYICIHESIHKEFHREYGYGNNTKEQWDEFLRKKGY